MTYSEIIEFWFTELEPQQWWIKDSELDKLIKSRFSRVHQQAMTGELWSWRETAQGALAEVIVLDQFSRNIFRDTAAAFASDSLALALAQNAVAQGHDQRLSQVERGFLYLPYMHSESKVIHQQAVDLYTSLGNDTQLDFEYQHKKIIDQFGRYPHRNEILGRASTAAEIEFLKQPNSGF